MSKYQPKNQLPFKSILASVAVASLVWNQPSRASQNTEFAIEAKNILNELHEIKTSAKSVSSVAKSPGIGLQNERNAALLEKIRGSFAIKNWHQVTLDSSRYLTLSQTPQNKPWLEVQFLLGMAYLNRGQDSRSIRALTRFLATAATSPDAKIDQVNQAVQTVLTLSFKSGENRAELRRLISSLSHVRLTNDQDFELRYLISKGATNSSRPALALKWLTTSINDSASPDQRARSLIFKGLSHIQERKLGDAEVAFMNSLSFEGASQTTKESANLVLARLYASQKKYQNALSTYSKIESSSEAYADALAEKSLLLVRIQDYSNAAQSIEEYLSKYPSGERSVQLRSLTGWLEIQSKDFETAKKTISSQQSRLAKMHSEVSEILLSKETIDYHELSKIKNLTKLDVTQSSDLDSLSRSFETMSDMEYRLSQTEGYIYNTLQTLSQSTLSQFDPTLAARLNQVNAIIRRFIATTSSLINADLRRTKDKLSSIDKQRITASLKRQIEMSSSNGKFTSDIDRLIVWMEPTEKLLKLNQQKQRKAALRAELPLSSTKDSGPISQMRDEFDKRDEQVSQSMRQTLSELQELQTRNMHRLSPIPDSLASFRNIASELIAIDTILESYEPNSENSIAILDDRDSRNSWKEARLVASILYKNLEEISNDTEQQINSTLSDLQQQKVEHDRTRANVAALKQSLERLAGQFSPRMLQHYQAAIGERIQRHQKWSADLDYLKYAKTTESQFKSKAQRDLELQILSDSLRSPMLQGENL